MSGRTFSTKTDALEQQVMDMHEEGLSLDQIVARMTAENEVNPSTVRSIYSYMRPGKSDLWQREARRASDELLDAIQGSTALKSCSCERAA